MAPRRPRYHLIDLVMVVLLCGLVAAAGRWVMILASQGRQRRHSPGEFLTTLIGLEVAFIAWFAIWKTLRDKRRAIDCPECGRRFVPPSRTKGPSTCPRCRRRSLSPMRLKRERVRNVVALLVVTLVCSSFVGFRLSHWVVSTFGRGAWIALPLLSVGAVLGFFLLLRAVVILIWMIRSRLLRVERHALARARKVARSAGAVVKSGLFTVWYSGPSDPVPMLLEQREAVRGRFEALLGGAIEDRSPLFLCFHERDALVAYHRQGLTDLWNYDGIYLPGPRRTITLSTEDVPYRMTDTERTARTLFGYHLLEVWKGFLPRTWLQHGMVNSVVSDDADDLARLNRKMLASLTKGTAFGADLFRLGPRAVVSLLRGWYDHGSYSKLVQITYQSWSVVEYLAGDGAFEERRGRFRAFLKEIRPKQPDEPVFERHFGHGFDHLLELWKAWVQHRGIETYGPPPFKVREALLGRVVPILRDPQARIMDRIQAVRDLGRLGYLLGADALIDLLRDPGEIPREEIVWSLEAISGLVLGDDPDRWRAWSAGHPQEAVGEVAGPSTVSTS